MRLKLLLSFATAVAASLCMGQDAGKRITFSAPASRASVLFPELAKQIGAPLLTVAQTENEVLLIQVKDMPVKELMDRIAASANAQWKKEGKAYRLVRPSGLSSRAEHASEEARTALMRRFLAEEDADAKKQTAWTPDRAQSLAQTLKAAIDSFKPGQPQTREDRKMFRDFSQELPITGAVEELIQQIGPRDLAAIGSGQRVVYALHPTAMQIPLPGESSNIVAQLVSEQAQYAQAFAALQPNLRRVQFMPNMGEFPNAMPGKPALGVGQAILVLSQFPFSGDMDGPMVAIQANFIVTDPAGETIVSGNQNYYRPMMETQMGKLDPTNPVTLSPTAQEFASAAHPPAFGRAMDEMPGMISHITGLADPVKFYRKIHGGAPSGSALSPELTNRLLRPEEIDPLSIFAGEALANAASALKTNLVADLPDACFMPFARAFRNGNSVIGAGDIFQIYCPRAGLVAEQTPSGITVAPVDPAEAENTRVNRRALGTLLRAIHSRGSATLKELSSFALSLEAPVGVADLNGLYLAIAGGSPGKKAAEALANPDPLRIYGTLTQAEQDTMRASGSIALDAMTADQKRWLADDVFNSPDGPNVDLGEYGPNNPPPPNWIPPAHGANYFTIKDERTQVLPNGIPPSGKLNFKFVSSPGLYGQTHEGGFSAYLSYADLAARQYQKERPVMGTPIQYDLYRPAKQATITFRFDFAEKVSLTRTLDEVDVDTQATAAAYDGLPADAKQQIEDILGKIRERMGRLHISSGPRDTGRTPPP